MSWNIVWTEPALRSLRAMHWRTAARIDAAILDYARAGRGRITRLPSDDVMTVRLHVGAFVVRLSLDRPNGNMTVWSIYQPA